MRRDANRRLLPFLRRLDLGLIGVLLLSLPAIAPLLNGGYFVSHDGMLHLYRLLGLDHAVAAGTLYPRWFPEFGFGYGHPILNFYGPFPYYVAELLHIPGLNLAAALKCAYALALVASAASMYAFAYRVFGCRPLPAVVAALAYLYAPYHLANLYVRGALAELWAMALVPLVLWSLTSLIVDRRRAHMLITAAALAALIATHSLSLVIVGPLLLVYVVLLISVSRQARMLPWVIGAVLLGLGLSAVYWLPALTESQYVGLAAGTSAGYRDHLAPLDSFLSAGYFYRYPPGQGTVAEYPAGLWQWLLALPGLVFVLLKRTRPLLRATLGLMTLAAIGSTFMTLTVSQPLWQLGEPALAFLQYPWRFQAVAALGASLLTGAGLVWLGAVTFPAMWRRTSRPITLLAVVVMASSALGMLPYEALPMSTEPTIADMWMEERCAGQIGTTWTGEYLPGWVQEQRWAIGRSWLDAGGPDPGEANAPRPPDRIQIRAIASGRMELEVSNLAPSTLLLHQFYFPGAGATLGDRWIVAHPYGVLGLAALDLPAGEFALTAGLYGTPVQRAGAALALCALVVIAILLWRTGRRRAVLTTLGTLLLVVGLLVIRHWTTPAPLPAGIQAEFEGRAALLAYSTDAATARPGEELRISLYWLARKGFESDIVTFIHLMPPGGRYLVAQSDHEPDDGFTPTTRWIAGEIIPDRHTLTLPPGLSPGRYELWAGMYEPTPLRNLEIISADQPVRDDRVLLGYLEIAAP